MQTQINFRGNTANWNNFKLNQARSSISELDKKLLLLQKYITDKLSRITDENTKRFYLRQTWEIAQQRLALRKGRLL